MDLSYYENKIKLHTDTSREFELDIFNNKYNKA